MEGLSILKLRDDQQGSLQRLLAVLSNLAQNRDSNTRVNSVRHPSWMESVAKMALPYEALIST